LSDETLMAYVDGELEEEKRAAVAQAVATDPEVARRVAEQRLLRASLQAAFSAVLEEPVPEHLVRAARSAPAGTPVADLASKRAARARLRRVLPQWGAIAASLIVGVFVGERFLGGGGEGVLVTQSGQLIAHGALAHALTDQLASSRTANASVQIGVSFRAHSGEYCRTFSLRPDPGSDSALAGLACHSRSDWRVDLLSRSAPDETGAYRQAGTAFPSAVSQALDAAIAGEPLDANGERAARARGWRP
jgi:hypothetical protein